MEKEIKFAGFWYRLLAYFIDLILLDIIISIISITFIHFSSPISEKDIGPFYLFYQNVFIHFVQYSFFILLFYNSIFEASKYQGSIGKIITKLKVVNIEYEKISFWQALGRNLSKYISLLIFGIGFLMIAFTKKKQGLHDMITNCLVVRK